MLQSLPASDLGVRCIEAARVLDPGLIKSLVKSPIPA
jgi:hypothetical protein